MPKIKTSHKRHFLKHLISAFCFGSMKFVFRTVLIVVLSALGAIDVFAQRANPMSERQASEFDDARPQYCWANGLKLEEISLSTPKDETITVVSRIGERDSKPLLNKRRLHNVRAYWTVIMGGNSARDPKTIILTEGERVKGLGQIEFYVRGKLVWILKVNPNTDFNAADCYSGVNGEEPCAEDWQKELYPCKDKADKRRQKRKTSLKKSRPRLMSPIG